LWQMILGGVFERFPSLELVFTEQGADWIPAVLSRLDEQYGSPFERQITDVLHKAPTEYWRSNCYVGASFMSWGESLIRDQLGVDRIMWGSDYPHIEGTWPRSHAALKEALNGCTEGEVRMMVGETAARVYGFDVDLLRPLAARLGPPIGELLTEEREPPVRYDPVDYALGRVSTRETTRRLMATLGRT